MKPTQEQVVEWARACGAHVVLGNVLSYETSDVDFITRVAALACAAGQASKSEWRPIETSPKDGTRILAVIPGFAVSIAWWFHDAQKWMTADAEDYPDDESWNYTVENTEYLPTHWMPLPAAPSQETDE